MHLFIFHAAPDFLFLPWSSCNIIFLLHPPWILLSFCILPSPKCFFYSSQLNMNVEYGMATAGHYELYLFGLYPIGACPKWGHYPNYTLWQTTHPFMFSEKTCHVPQPNDKTSMTPVKAIYHFDDVIHFSCDLGYERESGYWEDRCLENGTWSNGETLECKSKLSSF